MAKKSSKTFNCYECEQGKCTESVEESSICKNAVYCWKSSVRENNRPDRYARGCLETYLEMRFTCRDELQEYDDTMYRIECCDKEFCNNGSFPLLPPPPTPFDREAFRNTQWHISVLLPPLSIGTGLLVLVGMFFWYKHNRRLDAKRRRSQMMGMDEIQHESENGNKNGNGIGVDASQPSSATLANICSISSADLKITPAGDNTIKEFLDGQNLTSGSGAGLPLLMQRTFSKQISLVAHLNRGQFGYQCELWRGIWQGDSVMVKIYSSRSETLWAHETEVYTQMLPSKHDNILVYLGSDTTSAESCTQLWLVTQYHENGSLRRYLKETPLVHDDIFKLCLSLADGLLYLHTEIQGTQGKAPMAHRNLNSKNVFVKDDGTCVIADFGHAVTQERLDDTKYMEYASKRYMSPELLDQTCDSQRLETFQQADIYSLAILFWEICSRCMIEEIIALPYSLPFSEHLPYGLDEPTLDQMKKLVVINEYRPTIQDIWKSDEVLNSILAMIKECWQTKATARLPILRIKKTLQKISHTNSNDDSPLD